MTALRTSWLLRLALAATVLLAASLAGAGRGRLSEADPVLAVAGWSVPICHAGAPQPQRHAPADHDCCGDCALRAPAVLAEAPTPAGRPLRVAAAPAPAATGAAPGVSHRRDHYRARGPPVA